MGADQIALDEEHGGGAVAEGQGSNEQSVALMHAFGESGAQRISAQSRGLGRRDVFLGIAGPNLVGKAWAP